MKSDKDITFLRHGVEWVMALTTRMQNAEKLGSTGQTSVAEHCRASVNAASSTAITQMYDRL